jgi:hypothetical protein
MDQSAPTLDASSILEVTAPVRIEGESDSQTIFTWMVTSRYLWMLGSPWTDRVEDLVGTGRLLRLIGRRMQFVRKHHKHPAFDLPAEESDRDHAFMRLKRLLEMHINLDDVVNASRQPAT